MKELKDKLYETFTPEERVQLAIAALARQDDDEFNKLRMHCEKRIYRMNDARFTDRMEGIETMTRAFAVLCAQLCDKIALAQGGWLMHTCSIEWYRKGYELGLIVAGKNPETANKAESEKYMANLREIIDASLKYDLLITEQITHLKAGYLAFVEICKKENLNPEQLIKWFEIFKYIPLAKEHIDTDFVANQEMLEYYKESFTKLLNGETIAV